MSFWRYIKIQNKMNCCKSEKKEKKGRGVLSGLFYGLVAHSFCILFIILTVLGVTTLTTALRPVFMSSYFFHILVFTAIVFATISALVYLKKNNQLSFSGIKEKRNYLFILYGTTIAVNLILFIFIFPITANISGGASLTGAVMSSFKNTDMGSPDEDEALLTIEVDIPCSGHAYLVFSDFENFSGIKNINFRFPDVFDITYDPSITTIEEILSVDVLTEYKTTIK